MDEQIMESLAGFDALWQRVTGREEPDAPRPAQTSPLPELIREERCAAALSAALARSASGDGRAQLLRHAADARRHLRRLQAEYFILTGLEAGGGEECRPAPGRLACLRQAYLQAETLAGRYDQARDCAGPELEAALAAFAQDERRRAQQLRQLLVDSF